MRPSFVLTCLASLALPLSAQSACKIEGVWQLVSGSADGKPYPAGAREIKIITRSHFAFLYQDPSGPKVVRTTADSLSAYRTSGGGGGTYTLQGTSYVEKIEFFPDPALVGKTIAFTCRTAGDRFYQTGMIPVYEGGKKTADVKLEEVWRRVE